PQPAVPEPRVPYPHFSALDAVEQRLYVRFMIKYMSRRGFKPDVIHQKEYEHYQLLKTKCSFENVQFQKYLQNSARKCAEDYSCISADADVFTFQELLKACQKYVTNYPKFYTLHEVTSILGGKFIPDLTLKLEKCLLVKGAAQFARLIFPTSELELPTTFKKASSSVPPASKAAEISDPNTTKLSEKYCPHVTMTSQVLYTLLNNHGPRYKEQWEIPFCVKTITNGKSSKIVYMDSPLPKKEMTVREKSQIFHEVPVDLFMSKKSGVLVNIIQLDKMGEGQYTFTEDSRSVLQEPGENMEVDFENDVTELETFGTSKPPKVAKLLESEARTLMNKLMMEKQLIRASSAGDGGGKDPVMPELKANSTIQSLLSDSDDTSSFKGFESDELKDSKNRESSNEGASSEEDMEGSGSVSTSKISRGTVKGLSKRSLNEGDSDDDQLVIDIGCNGEVASYSGKRPPPSLPNVQESPILPKKPARRLSKQFDPVGQILKMQTQLLKPDAKKMQEPSAVNQMQLPAAMPPVTPMSEPEDAPKNTMYPPSDFKKRKSLLPVNLLTSKDDETEFTSPPNGNCTYKLYSLGDMLLLIQARVHKALTRVRAHIKSTRMQLPVYILTKMDYQTRFGAEVLTESESCRLWTETLLHSSSLLYIGHIDALTSKFFMLEEISQEWLKDRFGSLFPFMCVFSAFYYYFCYSLENGSYLLSHASGDSSVSIYKSIPSCVRGAYDLHKAHSSLPKAPTSLSVPWVPVDPNILLPIHTNHCWPPCTFPPQERLPASLLKVGHKSQRRTPPPCYL
uniref:Little elongation complex subunit 2 C-terminal domain-containing protein n=1 Tax=Leptobrachium leishanense TaxID=445787 RepID=A0A8C5Q2S3_9ANUR